MSLAPCPGCARHVAVVEVTCPFCAAPLAALRPPRTRRLGDVGRAAIFYLGASLAAAVGCDDAPESDIVQPYGAPPDPPPEDPPEPLPPSGEAETPSEEPGPDDAPTGSEPAESESDDGEAGDGTADQLGASGDEASDDEASVGTGHLVDDDAPILDRGSMAGAYGAPPSSQP